jgi:hypothetical protein
MDQEWLDKIKCICVHRPDIVNIDFEEIERENQEFTYKILICNKEKVFVKILRNDCKDEIQYDKVITVSNKKDIYHKLLEMKIKVGDFELLTANGKIAGKNFNFN